MTRDSTPLTRFGAPPSAEDIGDLAEHALAAIPARLRAEVRGVAMLVEEVADDETLAELGVHTTGGWPGLPRGGPRAPRGGAGPRPEPAMTLLYGEPILLEWIET